MRRTALGVGGVPGHRAALAGVLLTGVLVAMAGAPSQAAAPTAAAGQVYAFGENFSGELGSVTNDKTGEPNPTPAPVTLPGATGPAVKIAAGGEYSLVLTSTGQLYSFGSNYYGELGITTNTKSGEPNPTPTLVTLPGATGPVAQIAAGYLHSLVVTSTGQLYAFGENAYGQLGSATNNKTSEPNPTPALVTLPGEVGTVTQVAAGEYHSLVLTSTGQIYAFGRNAYGELGSTTNNKTDEPNPTPALVTLPGEVGTVTEVSAGESDSFAVTSAGQLYAFGDNDDGQLGNTTNNETNNPNPTPTPVALPGATGPVTQVAAGRLHTLVVTSTGQLYAFGENSYGQLGTTTHNKTSHPNPTPTLVALPGATGPVTQVAAGARHSLAVTSTGQLYSFGENRFGELGSTSNNKSEEPNPAPALVSVGAGATIDTVARGPEAFHTLVLIADLAVSASSVPGGQVGVPYSASPNVAGGTAPYSWRAAGLPAGLGIDSATGQITGTPTAVGSTDLVLTVSDAYGIIASSAPTPLTIAPATSATQPPAVEPPALTSVSLTNRRFRVARPSTAISAAKAPLGTIFRFTSSAAAKVQIVITRSAVGLRRGHRCLAPTSALRRAHAKRCHRELTVGTLTRANEPTGADRVPFSGRIGHRALSTGSYRAVLSASNAAGRSKPVTLSFAIVR